MNTKHYIKISCPDTKGLVAKISQVLYQFNVNIIEVEEFVNLENSTFYMRCETVGQLDRSTIQRLLKEQLSEPSSVEIIPFHVNQLVVFVTKESHCLGDLLMRHLMEQSKFKIVAVVSNHTTLEPLVKRFDLPFHHISAHEKSKEVFEAEIEQVLKKYSFDLIVLAKFMQIMSEEFVDKFHSQIINIHHSLLPAFTGANPYKRAYERGVKLVGATAHFVTKDLDEGPIIVQKVLPINHQDDIKRIKQKGHEVEKIALAEAVNHFVENRIFIDGLKSIVFE